MKTALARLRLPDRLPARMGLAALAILLAFAIFFWKERIFFGDASWIAFRVINFGTLQIQEHRYGSFITQLFPLLAVKAGWPLEAVLFLYSISFNLFYLAAGLFLFRWRQDAFLVLLALYFTVSVSVGFYWTNNEVHQGFAWLMLFFGWTSRPATKGFLFYPVAFGLLFAALSSHMLLLLAGGSMGMLLLLLRRPPFGGTPRGWILLLGGIALAGWRYYMSKVLGWYDEEKLSFIDTLRFAQIPEAFRKESSLGFLERWPQYYPLLPLLLLLAFGVLLAQKHWLAAGWHLLSLAAFWFFISMAFSDFTPWYAESDWASWTAVALAPLVLALPLNRSKNVVAGFLLLLFGVSLSRIWYSSAPFGRRLQQIEQLVQNLQDRKLDKAAVVLADSRALEASLILSWPLPVEVYSLAALSGKKPVTSLGILSAAEQLPATPDTLLIPFGKLSAKDFHPAYFPVDSFHTYTLLPQDTLLRWLEP